MLPISTKVLILSKVPFNNDEISVLKLGLAFTLTPPQNILIYLNILTDRNLINISL